MSAVEKKNYAEVAPFLQDKKVIKSAQFKDAEECEDTKCGFGLFQSSFLQRFATGNMFMILYGIGGCMMSMAFAYFNGTLTTLEKRYKIPTKITGIISVGNDMSTMVSSAILGYYAGRGHRPRWMGFGIFTFVLFCLLTSSIHFIYGPGDAALQLTREYGLNVDALNPNNSGSTLKDQTLCSDEQPLCQKEAGLWMPQVLLLTAQLISGIGQALFYVLGISYMDDNTTNSKTPAMLSWSTFVKMLGPAFGYSLASLCLRVYIAPNLQPLITPEDPRWLGAWWLGWFILAAVILLSAISLAMFPKELPKARARRLKEQQEKTDLKIWTKPEEELSLANMLLTVKRLLTNKVYLYNTFASIFYLFGYMAYWLFTPKYIETQYRTSASTASMATGSVALTFSAAGVLISGFVISRYQPSARKMAAWNGIVDFLTVTGILCYVTIGCDGSDKMTSLTAASASCSASCHCDFVQYAPICGANNVTYISACHAGCTGQEQDELGRNVYQGCACTASSNFIGDPQELYATDGACAVDCHNQFLTFLAVMCFLKLVGASARATNLLISLRCVSSEDKSFALGLGSMLCSLLSFVPSPVFFGWILDKYCLVWGKTCSSKGNCWLYDTKSLRYVFNMLAALFIFIGGFFNFGVWYHAKDLKIFDEEPKEIDLKEKK